MEKLPMCRVCLAENVRMYTVVNRNLRELYEKLTDNPFVTEDRRPMLACFFCCTKLKQCYRFQRKCLEAEELFAQMLNEDYKPNLLVKQEHPEFCNGFIQSPVVHMSIINECQTESNTIKEESPTVCERLHEIIDIKKEHLSDDVEDIPAQHSKSYSEYDELLTEFKIEVEEHEVVHEVARSSGQKPKLEDVITEDEEKKDKSDTKVVQTTEKCTNTATKLKEPLTDTKHGVNQFSLDTNCCNKAEIECEKLDKVIVSNFIKRRRRNKILKEKPFKCDVCQYSFCDKSHLTSHIRTHTGEKPYKCDQCQRSFNHKGTLKIHIRTHTGEKPYKCHICQRSFSASNNFTKHIRIHADEKSHKCEVCHQCFIDKCNLTRHIRTMHTGEKSFKCEVCYHSFNRKGSLEVHIRSHTGEKPYKCHICQRSFSANNNLKKHIRIHTGEKSHKCEVCQRCFIDKGNLRRHVIIMHTGDKSYKCDICQRSFNLKGNLIRHIRNLHN